MIVIVLLMFNVSLSTGLFCKEIILVKNLSHVIKGMGGRCQISNAELLKVITISMDQRHVHPKKKKLFKKNIWTQIETFKVNKEYYSKHHVCMQMQYIMT